MAIGEFTKQLAQQAILSATSKEPAKDAPAVPSDSLGPVILAQIAAMQKALKEGEELVVTTGEGAERIRVREIYLPSWRVAVLSGTDAERAFVRVIAPVETLQLTARISKTPAGVTPARVGLIAPKT